MAKTPSWKRVFVLLLGVSGAVALVTGELWAVVNQVDGQVVPIQVGEPCPGALDRCLQTGLDYGEGINPPGSSPSVIDAVLDANTGPGIFLVPKQGGRFVTVRFKIVLEGAGFESIFGWYNVGSPDVRYPVIFSCKDGNRNLYEGPERVGGLLQGGYEVTVDFQAEADANRYTEGQIGFYLVTPEDSPNHDRGGPRDNCATDPADALGIDDDDVDDGDDGIDDEGFGRIYYTETKLNNDGNYVHFLVYRSEVNPTHFYFGFEDLFRGGDNDYNDTMVNVEGLVPICEPTAEICNGLDDNCNGQIDEVSRPCANACGEPGSERCVFDPIDRVATWTACDAPAVPEEICNGIDDDCNPSTREEDLAGSDCVDDDGCFGTSACLGGSWVCDAPPKTAEICDGIDNNCNLVVDEGVTRSCATVCGAGIEQCSYDDVNGVARWIDCTAPQPSEEVCNGEDDDCDNVPDDGIASRGACTTPSGCQGQDVCQDGRWVCDARTPSIEVCDGIDNDCDGVVDDGVTRACFTNCGFGTETCTFTGDPTVSDWSACTAPHPEDEICDGVDNDCDGVVDNDVPGEDEICVPDFDACEPGRTKCVAGGMLCLARVGSPEVCDCEDNDCDDEVDEGDLCPGISECVDCACRIPCEDVEFACPAGLECVDGFCVTNLCNGVECGPNEECIAGQCRDLCTGVTCRPGDVCVDGRCVIDNCYGTDCSGDAICLENECVPHPCNETSCEEGEYCAAGQCRPSCGRVICGEDTICIDGQCGPDPCIDVVCASGVRCINGACDNACLGKSCGVGRRCIQGACVDDPCAAVQCLGSGERCVDGQCISPYTFSGRRVELLATGKGGLTCTASHAHRPPLLMVLLVFLLAGVTRRRRRSR